MIQHFNSIKPDCHSSVFVAPSAWVIGEVKIGEGSSVWFNSVVRGDVNSIVIGERTNIQDLSMLHVTNREAPTPAPLIIGNDVTIGHRVVAHGCRISDRCLIGIGAVILDGVIIEEDCIIGAGSVITPGKRIPAGSMVFGSPAKVIRELTAEERSFLVKSAAHYSKLAQNYKESVFGGKIN